MRLVTALWVLACAGAAPLCRAFQEHVRQTEKAQHLFRKRSADCGGGGGGDVARPCGTQLCAVLRRIPAAAAAATRWRLGRWRLGRRWLGGRWRLVWQRQFWAVPAAGAPASFGAAAANGPARARGFFKGAAARETRDRNRAPHSRARRCHGGLAPLWS